MLRPLEPVGPALRVGLGISFFVLFVAGGRGSPLAATSPISSWPIL